MEKQTGAIFKNADNRWDILFHDQSWVGLSSGTVIELKIGDQWVRTRIECDMSGYYSVVPGIHLKDGLPARLP